MNGNIYLRGEGIVDKKVARLKEFIVYRDSDAIYCAKKNMKHILNCLNKFNEKELIGNKIRKRYKKVLSEHDLSNRDKAICYINGVILEDDTHAKCIQEYINEYGTQDDIDEDFFRPLFDGSEDYNDILEENIKSIGFAHIVEDESAIYVEEFSLVNLSLNDFVKKLKSIYPNYEIYSDDTSDKIEPKSVSIKEAATKRKIVDMRKPKKKIISSNGRRLIDMRKTKKQIISSNGRKLIDMRKTKKQTASSNIKIVDMRNPKKQTVSNNIKIVDMRKSKKRTAGFSNRDFAIAIVNGKVYNGDTHGTAITEFLKDMGISDEMEFYDRDEMNDVFGPNFAYQFAFAHAVGDSIYIEEDTLQNINITQAAELIKQEYPDYKICDSKNKVVLNKKNRILERIKKGV